MAVAREHDTIAKQCLRYLEPSLSRSGIEQMVNKRNLYELVKTNFKTTCVYGE